MQIEVSWLVYVGVVFQVPSWSVQNQDCLLSTERSQKHDVDLPYFFQAISWAIFMEIKARDKRNLS